MPHSKQITHPPHLNKVYKRTHQRVAKHLLKKYSRAQVEKLIAEYKDKYEREASIKYDSFLGTFIKIPANKKLALANTLIKAYEQKLTQLKAAREQKIEDILHTAQIEAKYAELVRFRDRINEYSQSQSVGELKALLKKRGVRLN